MSIIRKLPVAKVGEIPIGATRPFRYGVHQGIAYNDAGTVKAYLNFCTHAGGQVDLRGSVLCCRRHHATFDPSTGERLSGQAPEGTRLKPINLTIEGDMMYAVLELHDEFE